MEVKRKAPRSKALNLTIRNSIIKSIEKMFELRYHNSDQSYLFNIFEQISRRYLLFFFYLFFQGLIFCLNKYRLSTSCKYK